MSTKSVSRLDSAKVVPLTTKPQEVNKLLQQYGTGEIPFAGTQEALYDRHLVFDRAIDPKVASARERFEAASHSVRDVLAQRWVKTKTTYEQQNAKRIYYLSMEFLLGRSLANNLTNLLLDPVVQQVVKEKGIDWPELIEQEPDAGLGNGGLGRLAACFLDSMATIQLPGTGYGLRYEYGMFRQSFVNGWQQEYPDNWLRDEDPWEIARQHEKVDIKLNVTFKLRDGRVEVIPGRPSTLFGIPFDRPVVGYGGKTINTLRLWTATAADFFDFQEFGTGDFVGALGGTLEAESLTRVLYPDDSTTAGQQLRFVQEYFLVACSLADLIRRFLRHNSDWGKLPEKAAIQLNDTHPSMAVAELMRILLDDASLGWDRAWDLTKKSLAYTNHTLLPEALEKWPVAWFETLLPRHLELIYEINRRLLYDVRARFPGDEGRVQRVSLVEEGSTRKIRMANLAIVGSHSTNGVSAVHSKLLRTTTVKDLAEMFPERFSNKTNGVTPRRWLREANPALAREITQVIGDRWITDLSLLKQLKPFAEASNAREPFLKSKRESKVQFADWLKSTSGRVVDPDTIFDCHIKRIHEYKRQLMNALRIVIVYNRLRENPGMKIVPRTFFFAGKAAPAYKLAKLIIKFINSLADTIDGDPAARGRLNVVFIPEYNVSLAERLIPASDVSNQISTAGYEASGTSNMKFMMNGALTVGTRDGATIEMAEEAGEDNMFLFGLTVEQAENTRAGHTPRGLEKNEPQAGAALDLIFSDHFSRSEPGVFAPLRDMLLTEGDHYMHLADLTSYCEAQERLGALYAEPGTWAQKAILNVASSGRFSSDRAIAEYASEIWKVEPCPVL